MHHGRLCVFDHTVFTAASVSEVLCISKKWMNKKYMGKEFGFIFLYFALIIIVIHFCSHEIIDNYSAALYRNTKSPLTDHHQIESVMS